MILAKGIKVIDNYLEYFNDENNLNITIEKIRNGHAFILKSAIEQNFIEDVKNYLFSIGRNSLPNYKPIVLNAENSHRINYWDDRSYIKGCFHQFSFFPWNQDIFNFFDKMKDIYKLRNIINGQNENKYLNNLIDDGCVARLSFQFYPKGIGGLNKHSDPVGPHQMCVPLLIMSEKGKDFTSGGLFIEDESKSKIYLDDLSNSGDVILFNALIPHGVDIIDENENEDWLSFEGRMMMIFAVNKVLGNDEVADAIDLD